MIDLIALLIFWLGWSSLRPAHMLLIERSSNGLVVFSSVFLAGLLSSLRGYAAIFVGTALFKDYLLFGLPTLLRIHGLLVSTMCAWQRAGARAEVV